MQDQSVTLSTTATTPSRWRRRTAMTVFVLFALLMGFYGLTAIEAAHTNFAAIHDPSVLEGRVAAQQRVVSGNGEGVATEYVRETGTLLPLISTLTDTQPVFYGHDGLYDTLVYYAEMPKSHIATLSLHNLLGGLCMLFGAFQFWPAFRQRYPRWHRGFGMVYMVAAQAGMIAAMAYMVMTPLEKMYDTLTFTVGLWFLAIGVTLTLWMSIWHLWRREYAQHQAYMALNYGFLLTAPFTRINWAWAAGLFPDMSQYTSNYLATAVLIPGCILVGYALLCMNRWLQKGRTVPNPKPGIAPDLQPRIQATFSAAAMVLAALGIVTLMWNGLLYPGLENVALAQHLVPASVISHDSQVLGQGLTLSRAIYAASAIAALLCAIPFLLKAFVKNAAPKHGLDGWAIGLAAMAAISGSIMLVWGWQLGGPSKATLAGGISFMFNGVCAIGFALLLLKALIRKDSALIKEHGVFTFLAVLAFPAFYWMLFGLNLFAIPTVYIDGGHVYRLSMYFGLFLMAAGVVYAAYGEATQRRFAR